MKVNNTLKHKFDIKLNNWHPKTNETVYRNVESSKGVYSRLDYHIRLSETTQL